MNQSQFPSDPEPALVDLRECQVCGSGDSCIAYRFPQRLPWAAQAVEQVVRRCRNCGFLFLSPRPGRAVLADYYAADSHGSGQIFRAEGSGSRADSAARQRAAFAADLLGRGQSLLDIGCGQGLFLAELAAQGLDATGLEPSPAAAIRARARGLSVISGELGCDPGRCFDAVSMISVLEHLWDPAEGLRQALPLLRPGGILLIEVPDALQPVPALTDFFSFEHLSHFTPATLARLLQAQGLRWAAMDDTIGAGGIRLAASAAIDPPARPGGLRRWIPLAEVIDRWPQWALTDDTYPRRQAALIAGVADRVSTLAARWRQEGRRIAIYGAGAHSLQLLELLPLQQAAFCFVDGDPRKAGTRYCDLPVHSPEALATLGVGAVLLSTGAFAAEMAARVRAVAPPGLVIADCYGEILHECV